jgi:nucleotide-binding universal stress UspA family protein
MVTATLAMQHGACNIQFKRILVGTDFSIASRRALSYALAMSRRYGSEISVVHAIPPEPRQPIPLDPLPGELNREQLQAREEMNALENEIDFRDTHYKNEIISGSAADVLVASIERDQPDLVILGTHGRGLVKRLALGSVAEEVLRLVSCPVLTVGPRVPAPKIEKLTFKSILFATDFGAASVRAFPFALFLAEDHGSRLLLLHMMPPMAYAQAGDGSYSPGDYALEDLTAWRERTREESLRRLKKMIPSGAKLASEPEYIVETSFLPEGILDVARIHESELIVMGANRTRSPRIAAHLPWAVIHDVLCEAKCPVLTVKE